MSNSPAATRSKIGKEGRESPSLLPPFKPKNLKLKLTREKEDFINAASVLENINKEPKEELCETGPLSPARLMGNTTSLSKTEASTDDAAADKAAKAAKARALASDRRKQAMIAKAPLPKQFGLPTNPITGAPLTTTHFIEESPLFNDECRDERNPMRTTLGITTAGNRAMAGIQGSEENEVDTKALAEITGMIESQVSGLLAQYVQDMKRSNRSMNFSQFKRFLKKHNFSDITIIKRLFEIFDVRKSSEISFAELCVGLCFFLQHKRWNSCREDPLFLDYSSRFFDISGGDGGGNEQISKFKFYQLMNCTFNKDFATEVTDGIWEIFSGTGGAVSYEEFQAILIEDEAIREVLHVMMVMQSQDREGDEYAKNFEFINRATRELRELKAQGRIWYLDRLAEQLSLMESMEDKEDVVQHAEEIAHSRKGRDSVAAQFYLKTFKHLVNERDGLSYIRNEKDQVQKAIEKIDSCDELDIDSRLRYEMGSAILVGIHDAYQANRL